LKIYFLHPKLEGLPFYQKRSRLNFITIFINPNNWPRLVQTITKVTNASSKTNKWKDNIQTCLEFYSTSKQEEYTFWQTNTTSINRKDTWVKSSSKLLKLCYNSKFLFKFPCNLHVVCMQHVNNSSLRQLLKTIQGINLNNCIEQFFFSHLGLSLWSY